MKNQKKSFRNKFSWLKKSLEVIRQHPEMIVRCSSEFVYFRGSKRVNVWIRVKKYSTLMEVKHGFNHSSDMDLTKSINWKRMVQYNGEYGCMGDLGLYLHFIRCA